jgi:transcriptional regulator with XRE-family HTH domain
VRFCVILELVSSGNVIRSARRRAGLTQRELAVRLGKSQSEIGRWERGEARPSFETVQRVVRACGLQLTTSLSAADDSYIPHIDRMLALPPRGRVGRAADQAIAMRGLRIAAGLAERA